MMCEEEGIYDSKLLSKYKKSDLKGDDKAFAIIDDLFDRASQGEEELYDQIYEMCWKKIRTRIDDKKSYRIGVNYDEE